MTRPAREVLFTVVSADEKQHAKVLMDSVVQRAGDALAAAAFQMLGARHGMLCKEQLQLPAHDVCC